MTRKSAWPTKEQELLLRAALLRGDEALAAWRRWRPLFEAGSFDEGSRRLLPLLYRNLKLEQLPDHLFNRLKEEYLHTWSQNQFCLRRIQSVIAAFNEIAIRHMLLKGAALAILYYEDVGLRPMKDIDLLVPHDQARQSMLELRNLHWTPRHASP